MSRNGRLVLLALAVLLPAPGLAQEPAERDPRTVDERLYFFLADAGGQPASSLKTARVANLSDPFGTETYAFVYYSLAPRAVNDSFKRFLRLADGARVDQQLAGSGLGGAASVASKTGLAGVLGLALETGAVTQTLSQSVMTLRANADGLGRFLSNQEIFAPCIGEQLGCRASALLKNLELSASFSVSDSDSKAMTGSVPGTGEAVTFSTSLPAGQLTSVAARYAIYNSRDLRSPEYRQRWIEWLRQNRGALAAAGSDLLLHFGALTTSVRTTDESGRPDSESGNPTQYQVWRKQTAEVLDRAATTSTEEEYRRLYARQLDELIERMRKLDPEFEVKLERLADAYSRYLSTRRSLASALVTDPALTVEYNYTEPQIEPRLHVVKVAFGYSPKPRAGGANPGTITLNGGFGFYNEPQPTGSGTDTARWRDVHAALQFDRPLGPPDSAALLSVGVYYQYLQHPAVALVPPGATTLPGTVIPVSSAGLTLLGESGSLVVGQAMLTLRIPGSGLRIPLGISWSNRTELATGNQVRGHVGFTFDPSALFLLTGGS